jgi:hypothetical protein
MPVSVALSCFLCIILVSGSVVIPSRSSMDSHLFRSIAAAFDFVGRPVIVTSSRTMRYLSGTVVLLSMPLLLLMVPATDHLFRPATPAVDARCYRLSGVGCLFSCSLNPSTSRYLSHCSWCWLLQPSHTRHLPVDICHSLADV